MYIVLCVLSISAAVRVLYSRRPLPVYVPDEVFVSHMESIRRQVDSLLEQERERHKYTSWSGYNGSNGYGRRYGSAGRGDSAASGSSDERRNRFDRTTAGGSTPLAPVHFDPNTVSYEALLEMNLPAYVSRNIIRYREAGGSFREPSDLEKIYGLSQEDFETLLPYIELRSAEGRAAGADPESDPVYGTSGPLSYSGAKDDRSSTGQGTFHEKNGYRYSPSNHDQMSSTNDPVNRSAPANQFGRWTDTLSPLELNRVDSADLLVLPGIGPWFAGRIIRYRDLLGGYVAPEQLLEVYGMDSARYGRIASFLTADSSLIERICLNTSTFQEVISHPYISREETYAIFRYREYLDTIPGPEKLLKDQIIDRDRFMRMAPYLAVKRHTD